MSRTNTALELDELDKPGVIQTERVSQIDPDDESLGETGKPEISQANTVDIINPDEDSIEDTAPGWYLYIVTMAVALGGVLFGYDLGVVSGMLVVIGDDLGKDLTSGEKELITSVVAAGAFAGCLIGGSIVDRVGRRLPLIIGSVLFTIGATIQASSFSVAQITVGRLTVGLGVGLAATVVPVFVAELAPSKYRGRMISLYSVCINGFQLMAYVIDFAFQNVKGGWRYMIGAAIIPSILFGVAIYLVPDSPRYLIQKGRLEEAADIIRKIYPNANEQQVQAKVTLIESLFINERANIGEYTLFQRLKILYGDKTNLKALIVICGLMAIQQLTGSNTMTYYAPTLFSLVGFTEPIAVGIVVAGTNSIFSTTSFLTVDRVGRRRLLVLTGWIMPFFLVIGGVAIHYIPINSDLTIEGEAKLTWAGILVLVSIICYIAGFAIGIGNIAWFGNEMLPMEVRSLSSTMLNCTCWSFNAIVGATYLSMMKSFTPSGAFGFYAGTTFFGWIAVIFFYPEVTDLTLEEIKEVFNHGFGVRYSSKLRKERKLHAKQLHAQEQETRDKEAADLA